LFFEIIRLITPWPNLSKRERTQINKTMNEKGEITTNTEGIQTIIRTYYEQLYANKLGNLEEMDAFLEMYKVSKLNQDEVENLNRPITSKEIEALVKTLPKKQEPRGQMASQGSSTKHLKN